ncbi:hypothetical protein FDUTEX481_09741 [Tolypothrix sp. PCC 7601]|nr:hypothetical protein FDUTEX481_09741 [Tolypothrix sp. PCC 7601]
MSKPEQPQEKDKPSEKQMIVDGLLFVFVLVPSLLFVFSMIITDYLAQRPPARWLDDAARNSKTLECQSRKQNKSRNAVADCEK